MAIHIPSVPKYLPPFPISENLHEVRITLRRLVPIFGSPNHWGIAIETDSGWVSLQIKPKGKSIALYSEGEIGISYHENYTSAALDNWGRDICNIRSSSYGCAYSNLTLGDLFDYIENLKKGEYSKYILAFNDCQNFSRALVKFLTGKWVGIWPIENGPHTLYYETI